jgi:hypothetical protein
MKKHLITLAILMLIALDSISQTSKNDTICLPINELKVAINKIEVCEVMKIELNETKYILDLKNRQLANQDSEIVYLKKREKRYVQLVDNMKKINSNYQKNIYNATAKIEYQEKVIRRKNRHKFIYGILGFILAIVVVK